MVIYYIQGVWGQTGFFNLALREKNIQARLYLKVVLKSWDVDILIIGINFQKSLNSLQQKRCKNWNMIFHDSTKINGFQNIKIKLNSRTWMTLDDSGVLSSDFPSLRISTASITLTASTASVASMTHILSTVYTWILVKKCLLPQAVVSSHFELVAWLAFRYDQNI